MHIYEMWNVMCAATPTLAALVGAMPAGNHVGAQFRDFPIGPKPKHTRTYANACLGPRLPGGREGLHTSVACTHAIYYTILDCT